MFEFTTSQTTITQECRLNCSGHGQCAKISESSFGCVCDTNYAGINCGEMIDFDWKSH